MKKLVSLTALLLCVLFLFACGAPAPETTEIAGTPEPAPQPEVNEPAAPGEGPEGDVMPAVDNSLTYITDKKEIIMGLDDGFPPMGFRDEKGELVGFDIDLAKAVADKMGISLKLQPIDWKAKDLELQAKNIDVIWNGYTITEERKTNNLVSPPYMENKQVVIVPTNSPINTLKDLEGKKVAVQDGSSAQEALADTGDLLSKIEQVDFKDNVTAMLDVSIGMTDALAVDIVVAEYYMAKDAGKFRILNESLAPEEYGIGFRKGEQAFHDAVMKAYGELKADGTLKAISEKWFGRDVTF